MDFESKICVEGEMSICEEIECLDVPQETKDRIFRKIEEMNHNFCEEVERVKNEYYERMAKECDQFNRMAEQNLALKNACFALADALKQEMSVK